jgi:hypothetical protein
VKTIALALGLLAAVVLAPGCASAPKLDAGGLPLGTRSSGKAADGETEAPADRMLVWKAHLRVQVWDVSQAVDRAVGLAEGQGGFAERKTDSGEGSASVTLRVPAKVFASTVADLDALGPVTSRVVQGEDVTEQCIDADARLKNKVVLRDRLKQLLDKATDVTDVLAIETELNRVQSDIDSMEGRLKALRGQVEYATITLSLERKPVPGPLGYLLKGVWWGLKKLFVLRE